jgi:hypothetical protein
VFGPLSPPMTATFRSVGNVNLHPFITSFEIRKDAD